MNRLLTAAELQNFTVWRRNNPRGPRINPEGAFDGKGGDGHPRHRNLGVDLRHFGRGGAFDTASAEPTAAKSISGILSRLAASCDESEWLRFRTLLLGESEETEAEDDMPKNGIEQSRGEAMDSAGRLAFDSQFPRAGRVQRVDYSRHPAAPSKAVTAEGAKSFAAMFPGAQPARRV